MVDYRETARQTIVRRANGRVLMTEMTIDDASVKTVVNVLYESDPKSGVYVPTVMKERYERGLSVVEGRATYANFRKFSVETKENLRTVK